MSHLVLCRLAYLGVKHGRTLIIKSDYMTSSKFLLFVLPRESLKSVFV